MKVKQEGQRDVDWLDQHSEAAESYMRRSKVPHALTTPDGKFLWANGAWEEMLDYSLVELQALTWQTVTASPSDADYDSQMAAQLAADEPKRTSYDFRKSYRRKDGLAIPVVIEVQRYPVSGDFQFFVVTAIPEPPVVDVVRAEVAVLRKELRQIEAGRLSVRFIELANKYPKVAMMTAGFVLFLIFGKQATEYLRELASIFMLRASQ